MPNSPHSLRSAAFEPASDNASSTFSSPLARPLSSRRLSSRTDRTIDSARQLRIRPSLDGFAQLGSKALVNDEASTSLGDDSDFDNELTIDDIENVEGNNAVFAKVLRGRTGKMAAIWRPSRSSIAKVSLAPLEPANLDLIKDSIVHSEKSCVKYMQDTTPSHDSADKSESSEHILLRDLYSSDRNLSQDFLASFQAESQIAFTDDKTYEDHSTFDITTVPSIFFSEHFELDKPQIFHQVCYPDDLAISSEASVDENRRFFSNNIILQEKLSWFLDIVEICIIRETESVSQSFFETLSSLEDFDDRVRKIIDRLQQIKDPFKTIISKNEEISERILAISQQKEDLLKFQKLISELTEIIDLYIQKAIPRDVPIEKRLNVITHIESSLEEIDREHPGIEIVNLMSKACNREREENISIARSSLIDFLIQDFHTILMDANFGLYFEKRSIELCRLSSEIPGFDEKVGNGIIANEQLIDYDTIAKLAGVMHCYDRIPSMLAKLRSSVIRDFKQLLKGLLPSLEDEDQIAPAGQSSAIKGMQLAEKIRSMTTENFHTMIVRFYGTVITIVQRLKNDMSTLLNESSESDVQAYHDIYNEVIKNIGEISVNRLGKLFVVRSNTISSGQTDELLSEYLLQQVFCTELEDLCHVDTANISRFWTEKLEDKLNTTFSNVIMELTATLDADKWEEIACGPLGQSVVDKLVESAQHAPRQWLEHTFPLTFSIVEEVDASSERPNPMASPQESKSDDSERMSRPTKKVRCGQSEYYISKSAVCVFKTLERFCQWGLLLGADGLPILHEMIIELVRRFDSRTRQLILGAGATLTAGLKNITARHLAVASQSIEILSILMESLASFLRSCYRRWCLGYSRVESEYDKVFRELRDHLLEIDNKFVDIMRDRAQFSVLNFKRSDWKNERVHPYMEELVKDIGRIEKILVRFFGPSTRGIMYNVNNLLQSKLADVYKVVPAEDQNFLIADVNYYLEATKSWNCGSDDQQSEPLRSFLEQFEKVKLEKDENQIDEAAKVTSVSQVANAVDVSNQNELAGQEDSQQVGTYNSDNSDMANETSKDKLFDVRNSIEDLSRSNTQAKNKGSTSDSGVVPQKSETGTEQIEVTEISESPAGTPETNIDQNRSSDARVYQQEKTMTKPEEQAPNGSTKGSAEDEQTVLQKQSNIDSYERSSVAEMETENEVTSNAKEKELFGINSHLPGTINSSTLPASVKSLAESNDEHSSASKASSNQSNNSNVAIPTVGSKVTNGGKEADRTSSDKRGTNKKSSSKGHSKRDKRR